MCRNFRLLFYATCLALVATILCEDVDPDEWTPAQLVPDGYERQKIPIDTQLDHQPVLVSISTKIIQLVSINEAEQSYTIDIMYQQKWPDYRLVFPPQTNSVHGNETMPLDMAYRTKVWVPDVYIINAIVSVVQPTPLYLEIEVNSSRLVLTSRQIVKLRCSMDLYYFPQDTQDCDIEFALLTIPTDKAILRLDRFLLRPKKEFTNFYIVNAHTAACESLRGPNFSCVKGQIQLYRKISYYIIRIYGPSFLLVITAFVGFWIPPCGYPARVALIVTPLLSLITQQTQINSEINVSYVVALHIWMIFSIFFVFMSLVEYALCIVYCHVVDEKKDHATRDPIGFSFAQSSTRTSHWIKNVLIKVYGHVDYSKNPLDRNKIDYVSRLVFPIMYITFVFCYMCVFLFPWLASRYY